MCTPGVWTSRTVLIVWARARQCRALGERAAYGRRREEKVSLTFDIAFANRVLDCRCGFIGRRLAESEQLLR